MIDDGIHNLMDGAYIKILFDAPWNRNVEAAMLGMYRVADWETIKEIIDQLGDIGGVVTRVGVKSREKQDKEGL